MNTPFPGMDPYLEHPALWPGVHARLIVWLAHQLTPLLRPRYVVSIEDRVFIEDQDRLPDIQLQKGTANGPPMMTGTITAAPVIVEVEDAEEEPIPLEMHEHFIEILDTYRAMKVVTVLEIVRPSNKAAGPGRTAYRAKQRETLASECHFVEIDLLRRGRHVLAVPAAKAREQGPYDYLISVNRWPNRKRFELFLGRLREPCRACRCRSVPPMATPPLISKRPSSKFTTMEATCSACCTISLVSRASATTISAGQRNNGPRIGRGIRNGSRRRSESWGSCLAES